MLSHTTLLYISFTLPGKFVMNPISGHMDFLAEVASEAPSENKLICRCVVLAEKKLEIS